MKSSSAGPEVLIVGPGAVGLVLAGRWALAGRPVRLLGRDARGEARLVSRGFDLIGTNDAKRRVRRGLFSARALTGPCEASFFCVKSYDLPAALRAAKPWIGPDTAVVSLQNGVGHEALLRRAFGPARAVAATAYFAADREGPSTCLHRGGRGIVLARAAKNKAAANKAAALLRAGGWRVQTSASEARMLWTKLCFNAASNPLGSACRATNGQLAEDPALRRVLLAALDEALAIARKAGRPPVFADMRALILDACRGAPLQRNSMLQDIEDGRRTELDAIVSPLLRAARASRTPAPVLGGLERAVRSLERAARRRNARPA